MKPDSLLKNQCGLPGSAATELISTLAPPHLSSPHEPQLEDVDVAPTLQRFVSGVVGQVVVFVLLEQVAGVHLVAVLHQTL